MSQSGPLVFAPPQLPEGQSTFLLGRELGGGKNVDCVQVS